MKRDTKRFRDDLNSLVNRTEPGVNLTKPKSRNTIPDRLGVGRLKPYGDGESGIASPLTEEVQTRTYHTTEEEITSSDGLFTLVYHRVASITMKDANEEEAVLNFSSDPDAPI